MDDLKNIIAKNLVELRTNAGFTQLQLAEMLNYSDKAVSKWERAEAIPDLRVLIQIAKIYNITLDELVSEQAEKPLKPKMNLKKKHAFICLLSVGLTFFIAAVLFTILYFIPAIESYAGCVFAVAPFASAIILTVFSAVWGNRKTTALSCSAIVWTLVIMVNVFMWKFGSAEKVYLFYIVAAVFQVLIVLWFAFRKVK